jgi:hypothetical protein
MCVGGNLGRRRGNGGSFERLLRDWGRDVCVWARSLSWGLQVWVSAELGFGGVRRTGFFWGRSQPQRWPYMREGHWNWSGEGDVLTWVRSRVSFGRAR